MALTANHSPANWSVESAMTESYPIAPGDFLLKKQVRDKMFDLYQEDTLFDWFVQGKRYETSKNGEFNWYELGPIYDIATVESFTGSAGAGVPAVITLEEEDHLGTGTKSMFQPNQIVGVFLDASDTVVMCQVTATNKTSDDAHVVTVDPIDDTDDITTTLAAGDRVFLVSTGHGDGTFQPESMVRKPDRLNAHTQIFKHSFETDGSESANHVEVTVKGKNFWYNQGIIDADLRHRLAMDYQFLIGPSGSKADATDATKTAYYSDSFESVIGERGNDVTYTTFGLGDVADIVKQMAIERNPIENLLVVGQTLNIDWDDTFRGLNDQGNIVYTNWGKGNANMRAIDYGFDSLRYGNFVFHKKVSSALDSKSVTSFTDSPYTSKGYLMPLDRGAVGDGGKMQDKILMYTKANDRDSRFIRTDFKDRFKIDGKDGYNYDILSEVGLQLACANQMYLLHK